MADPAPLNDGPTWDRIRNLFWDTFEATADDRRRILDARAGNDPSVRRRVEDLLAAHDRPDGALDRPALASLHGIDPLHLPVQPDPVQPGLERTPSPE